VNIVNVKEVSEALLLALEICSKFIAKVDSWRARSVETYREMKDLQKKIISIWNEGFSKLTEKQISEEIEKIHKNVLENINIKKIYWPINFKQLFILFQMLHFAYSKVFKDLKRSNSKTIKVWFSDLDRRQFEDEQMNW
jgi:hypothetical protein